MIEEARKRGIKRIIVDHPSWWLNKATPQQPAEMAHMGAYVGLYWCAAVPNVTCLADPGEMLDVIEKVPIDRIVGGCDAASVGHPDPLEAMRELIVLLLYGGVPKESVEQIFVHNPNRLIFGQPNEV